MINTYWMPSDKTTNLPQTGQVVTTVDSHWSGFMRTEMSIFPCQAMLKNIGRTSVCSEIFTSIPTTRSCTNHMRHKNTRQYVTAPDTPPLLNLKDTKHIQLVTGSFLYYGRALNHTILLSLNKIASEQAQPTQKIMDKAQRLMDYANTYQNTYI